MADYIDVQSVATKDISTATVPTLWILIWTNYFFRTKQGIITLEL